MVNCSFVKTPEEINAAYGRDLESSNFFMQEKIQLYWTCDERVARSVLPPHIDLLMPNGKPVILAYIAWFGHPETHYPYTEGALFVLTRCRDAYGVYPLAMPLDGNDQATARGREMFGYPKKAAAVKLMRQGDRLSGYIERNDIRFFEASLTLGEAPNDPVLGAKTLGAEGPQVEDGEAIILKYDMDSACTNGEPLGMCNFRIQAQNNYVTFHEKRYGRVDTLRFAPSEDDPWIELAPRSEADIFGGIYCRYETKMRKSRNLYTYTPEEYESVVPYAFAAWDTVMLGKAHASYRTPSFLK